MICHLNKKRKMSVSLATLVNLYINFSIIGNRIPFYSKLLQFIMLPLLTLLPACFPSLYISLPNFFFSSLNVWCFIYFKDMEWDVFTMNKCNLTLFNIFIVWHSVLQMYQPKQKVSGKSFGAIVLGQSVCLI